MGTQILTLQVEDGVIFLELLRAYEVLGSLPGASIELPNVIVEHLLERSDYGTAKVHQIIPKTRPA